MTMISERRQTDLGAGALISVIGAAFLVLGRNLEQGTASTMGPGYFPRYVAGIAILIGITLIVQGLRNTGAPLFAIRFRPFLLLLCSMLFFGFAIERLGLALSSVGTVVIASLAAAEIRWRRIIVTAVLMSAFVSLLFVVALGLPIALWPVR